MSDEDYTDEPEGRSLIPNNLGDPLDGDNRVDLSEIDDGDAIDITESDGPDLEPEQDLT